jgi:hypothetical protein
MFEFFVVMSTMYRFSIGWYTYLHHNDAHKRETQCETADSWCENAATEDYSCQQEEEEQLQLNEVAREENTRDWARVKWHEKQNEKEGRMGEEGMRPRREAVSVVIL